MKDLTVIITCYNKYPMINYIVEFFNRHYMDNIEVICIDDHSAWLDDMMPEWKKIKYIVNPINQGIGKVRQQALELAVGKYIVFVDGDDIPCENYLSVILEAIKSNADVIQFTAIGWPQGDLIEDDKMVWNKAYRRQFILDNNLSFLPHEVGEDMDFNEAFYALNPKIYKVKDIIYIYNMVTDGLTHTLFNYQPIINP